MPQTGFAVARVKRNLGARSSVGGIFTQRNPDGGAAESLYGLDIEIKPTQRLQMNGYWSRSELPGVDGDDASFGAGFEYSGPTLTAAVDLVESELNFDPGVGFLLRRDFRMFNPQVLWQPRIERGGIRSWWAEATHQRFDRSSDGRLESERTLFAPIGMAFESDDFWQLGIIRTKEQLFAEFEIFPGVVIPKGLYPLDLSTGRRHLPGLQRELDGAVALGASHRGSPTHPQGHLSLAALTSALM